MHSTEAGLVAAHQLPWRNPQVLIPKGKFSHYHMLVIEHYSVENGRRRTHMEAERSGKGNGREWAGSWKHAYAYISIGNAATKWAGSAKHAYAYIGNGTLDHFCYTEPRRLWLVND